MQNENKKQVISNKKESLPAIVRFHIEIDKTPKGMSIVINGADCIIDYTEKGVEIKTGKSVVKIDGENLSLALYENKTVEIVGRIGAVSFL